MKPSVSIITPAYNVEKVIGDTIHSVQRQTLKNWEMNIVNDCSKDETAAVVRKIAKEDPRVRFHEHVKNLGPAEARNTAVRNSTGRYLAFLDSDDLWLPEKLESQLEFMEKNSLTFTYTAYRRIRNTDDTPGKLVAIPNQLTYQDLLKHTAIATSTVIIDSEKVGPIHLVKGMGYDDFILWLDILKRGHVAVGFNRDLMRYRLIQGSVSHNKARSAKWVWNIYRQNQNLSIPSSAWYFLNYAIRGYLKHRTF